ncbi:hypothetical protein CH373_16845 [Leptospira perolatii]|uniref:Thiamine pyrophosphate enzyme N-terminal TPP-binding domain-containing protein n=1 Tax=Leptospira perolatii TaxID=2023191 RepID=A0A2M9ZIQ4_9LEPT|nr:hypothetical protein CH360_16155 [Leptospira perolatii]PJZ71902.1 hypothetical protein CH373_16845 [Leptospira perolatii]
METKLKEKQRSTGSASVCFASSGPGVTNLVTAVADDYCDSVPLVIITGQVPLHLKRIPDGSSRKR